MGAARRLATAVAYGGSGVGLLGVSTIGILALEGLLARRFVGPARGAPPDAAGCYLADDVVDGASPPLSLILLGDSSAAGLGGEKPLDTPGAQLALGLSAVAGRAVRLHCVAVVGAQASHLDDQVAVALCRQPAPDVAMLIVGVNDITHLRRAATSATRLAAAIRRLRAAGAAVVVGTCPDLSTIRPIPQPLRSLAAARGRQLAARQHAVAVEEGAATVSLGDLLGPQFAEHPAEMFSPDRFHPSPVGYAAAAAALLPSAAAALGLDASTSTSG